MEEWLKMDSAGRHYVDADKFQFDWHAALPWLCDAAGMSMPKARTIVGKVAKYIPRDGDRWHFWRDVIRSKPADPIPYIHKMLAPYSDAPGVTYKKSSTPIPPIVTASYSSLMAKVMPPERTQAELDAAKNHVTRMLREMERND